MFSAQVDIGTKIKVAVTDILANFLEIDLSKLFFIQNSLIIKAIKGLLGSN